MTGLALGDGSPWRCRIQSVERRWPTGGLQSTQPRSQIFQGVKQLLSRASVPGYALATYFRPSYWYREASVAAT